MVLWTANDDSTGKPKYDTDTGTIWGVDRTEAKVKGTPVSPGWVRVLKGTGGIDLVTVSTTGSGYTASDVVTIDGGANPATSNATANITVYDTANLTGTVAILSGGANVVGTGTTLTSTFANGDSLFAYHNTTSFSVKKINQVVNTTFMNITSTWTTANATAAYGKSGLINAVSISNPGAGFTTTTNVAITSTNGANAVLAPKIGGKGGRINYETMVYIKNMTNDAADDATFPDA